MKGFLCGCVTGSLAMFVVGSTVDSVFAPSPDPALVAELLNVRQERDEARERIWALVKLIRLTRPDIDRPGETQATRLQQVTPADIIPTQRDQ